MMALYSERTTDYQPRFVPRSDKAELINLYHLARTPVGNSSYDRRVWAAREYSKAHPNVSMMGAYKDLEGWLA